MSDDLIHGVQAGVQFLEVFLGLQMELVVIFEKVVLFLRDAFERGAFDAHGVFHRAKAVIGKFGDIRIDSAEGDVADNPQTDKNQLKRYEPGHDFRGGFHVSEHNSTPRKKNEFTDFHGFDLTVFSTVRFFVPNSIEDVEL